MQRASLIGLLALACVGVASAAAAEADLQPEIRRGFLAVGHSTSDVPALRVEAAHATPSAGFALGAALGGWINAAATLDYDLKTPSGDGDDSETIHLDCIDEAAMLQRLEQLRRAAALGPAAVLADAGADRALLSAWTRRQAGPVAGCH